LGQGFRIFLNWFKLVQEFRISDAEGMLTSPGAGQEWYDDQQQSILYDSFT
jgi:hypothetical protein